MQPVTLRNLTVGTGAPKIVAPLTGAELPALLAQSAQLLSSPAQMAEWRVDCLSHPLPLSALPVIAAELRRALSELPLLATYRTTREGGQGILSGAEYAALVETLAESGLVDMVDVELSAGVDRVSALLDACHARNVAVLLSFHDFHATPSADVLLSTLRRMEALGADIAKIAVMPQSPADVVTLLSATEQFSRSARCPAVTMSMGALGKVSRVWGEVFGSALTFAAVAESSAPGQLPATTVAALLDALSLNRE